MKRIYGFAALAFLLFALLVVVENLQSSEPFDLANFAIDLFEKALLVLAVAATAFVALETRGLKRERIDLLNDLSRVRNESDRWRAAARVHIDGLGLAIRDQFKTWKLSDGEADIALLMLKGMTQKEIAHLRGSEESTVRQQAAAIYRKSGLANRSELGAYFLEDLLAPSEEKGLAQVRTLEVVKSSRP
jgi:DNA-binding CsgD family transcriptional regulator